MTKILELFTTKPECWIKGDLCLDADGERPLSRESEVCWCLMGAVRSNYEVPDVIVKRLVDVIFSKYPSRVGDDDHRVIASFNDHPETTIDDIVAVVREAGV